MSSTFNNIKYAELPKFEYQYPSSTFKPRYQTFDRTTGKFSLYPVDPDEPMSNSSNDDLTKDDNDQAPKDDAPKDDAPSSSEPAGEFDSFHFKVVSCFLFVYTPVYRYLSSLFK